ERAAATLMQAAAVESDESAVGEHAAAALFRAAEAWEKLADLPAAHAACEQILNRFPDSPWADDALETRTRLTLIEHDYPRTLSFAEEFAKRFPTSPRSTSVRQMLGRALLRLDRVDESIAIFELLTKQ